MLPKYQTVCKEQCAEQAPCRKLRAEKGNAVHIPAAEKAAQDT